MCSLLARQTAVAAGDRQGESALFFGHLSARWSAAVDGRSLGRFLREEICGPHDLDFHIGLGDPELARVADLTGFNADSRPPSRRRRSSTAGRSRTRRARRDPRVLNGERWRRAEVPAVNGHGTARAVAGFYVALAHGDLLGPGLLGELASGRGVEPELVIGGDRACGASAWSWTPTATAWAASAGASAGGARPGSTPWLPHRPHRQPRPC